MRVKPLGKPASLYVTCSMTPPHLDLGAEDLKRIHRMQGHFQIAVHHVVRRNGALEAGRPLSSRGASDPEQGDSSLQVCLIGGLTEDLYPRGKFSKQQVQAVLTLADYFGVPIRTARNLPDSLLKEFKKHGQFPEGAGTPTPAV